MFETYVCDWEVDVGAVKGRIGMGIPARLLRILEVFDFHMDDRENALVPALTVPLVPDITFLRVRMEKLDLGVVCGEDLLVRVVIPREGLSIWFGNAANARYTQRISLTLSELRIYGMVQQGQRRRAKDGGKQGRVGYKERASLSWIGSPSISIFVQDGQWKEVAERQRAFVMEQDSVTHRCDLFYQAHHTEGQGMAGVRGVTSQGAGSKRRKNRHGMLYIPPLRSNILGRFTYPLLHLL